MRQTQILHTHPRHHIGCLRMTANLKMCSVGATILGVVLVLASFQIAESIPGCNCTRLHPQQHYCTANYVIRGKVMLLRWQLEAELHTEPSTVTGAEPVTDPTTDATASPRPTELEFAQTEDTQAEEGGDREQGDAPNPTDGPSSSLQPAFLDAMPARRQDRRLLRNRLINQEPWNYQIIYTIKIQDVFKMEGGDSPREGEEVEIVSAYPGAGFCGVELKAGKSYILAGGLEGRITMCDWIQEYKDVSKRQKLGLKNNYGKSCDKCQIKTCLDAECISDLPPKTCSYLPPHEDYDRYGIGYQSNDCTARYLRCHHSGGKKVDRCYWKTSREDKVCSRKNEPIAIGEF